MHPGCGGGGGEEEGEKRGYFVIRNLSAALMDMIFKHKTNMFC